MNDDPLVALHQDLAAHDIAPWLLNTDGDDSRLTALCWSENVTGGTIDSVDLGIVDAATFTQRSGTVGFAVGFRWPRNEAPVPPCFLLRHPNTGGFMNTKLWYSTERCLTAWSEGRRLWHRYAIRPWFITNFYEEGHAPRYAWNGQRFALEPTSSNHLVIDVVTQLRETLAKLPQRMAPVSGSPPDWVSRAAASFPSEAT